MIGRMIVAETHDAKTQGEAPTWAWPLCAFVAWLASILGYVTHFRRIRHTHRFRQDWRDSWKDLRQSEWLRDQLIAQGLTQLIAGAPLQLDDTRIAITPPSTYGGPCPRTPFDMNRRFLALARWAADPEAHIRERFRRLRNPLLADGSMGAARCPAAQHEPAGVVALGVGNAQVALMLSRPQRGRPSKHERGLTTARGPPVPPFCYSLLTIRLSAHASEIAPARLEQPTPRRTSGGPICHRSAASRSNGTSCGRGPVS
jgi:hypothetical protein